MIGRRARTAFLALAAMSLSVIAGAQPPDVKQMSGIPRPVDDLPDGTVSVRLVRGSLSNLITNHEVDLVAGSTSQKANTDAEGRAEFHGLSAGTMIRTSAVVNGETLTSETFAMPPRGGIRLLLVARDGSAQEAPTAGEVVLGGQSRIIIELGDESIQLYYLLDIVNPTQKPVNPASLFMFDMPTGAFGTSVLEGSSPLASVNGTRVRVQGPFPPGTTSVEVGCGLPYTGSTLSLSQTFPAKFERLAVMTSQLPGMSLLSPQITSQQAVPVAQGPSFISGVGGAVPAGQPVSITLEGLPHHSPMPRWIAMVLVMVIVVSGTWVTLGPADEKAQTAERRDLVARRERLFADLVRLERDHRSGKIDVSRYSARRGEIVAALELVYGALDSGDTVPLPSDGAVAST